MDLHRRSTQSIAVSLLLVLFAVAPSAEAQILDRLKRAAQRTAQAAGDVARETIRQESMNEINRLLLADGAFAGTATPWLSDTGTEAVDQVALSGQAFAADQRVVILFCEGPAGLDGILVQIPPAEEAGPQELTLSDDGFMAVVLSEGQPLQVQAEGESSVTGLLSVESGEDGGIDGSLSLTLDAGVLGNEAMAPLFTAQEAVVIEGDFRAAPTDASPSCD